MICDSARAATVGLSAARARVLEYLEAQPEAVTAARTAADLDLHGNTARLHLEGLVGAGLATRTKQAAGGRGRDHAAVAGRRRGRGG